MPTLPALLLLQGELARPTVYVAVSENGTHWKAVSRPVATDAAYPDGIRLPVDCEAGKAGDILVFYNHVEDGKPGGLRYALSKDGGITFGSPSRVVVDGTAVPLEPSVVFSDGRIMLYFRSEDGVRQTSSAYPMKFPAGAVAWKDTSCTGPEVVQGQSRFMMFAGSGGDTILAESSDGVAFAPVESFRIRSGGSVGCYTMQDGRIRLFHSARGVWSSTVAKDYHFTKEAGYHLLPDRGTVLNHASPVAMPGGRHLLFVQVGWSGATKG
jgi:hypothetical protein